MLYASPEHLKSVWSRRSLLKASAAGVAVGVASSFSKIAAAEDGLRTIGLGVSIVNEVQDKATKDLGFTVAGQAMGYGDMFSKMLNQNDQYEIAEGYFATFTPSPIRSPSGSTITSPRLMPMRNRIC
jgi:hypothetical protein